MNSNVLVTIKGLQHEFAENDTGIQTMQQGKYSRISDKHVIAYEELVDSYDTSTPAVVKNILKISDDLVTLTKRGYTTTDMVFKEGYQHTGMYETPFGTLQMGIITSKLTIKEEADTINIQIDYGLEINYSHVSDCSIYINIRSM